MVRWGGVGGCWDKGGLVKGKYGIGGSSGRVVGVRGSGCESCADSRIGPGIY